MLDIFEEMNLALSIIYILNYSKFSPKLSPLMVLGIEYVQEKMM